VWKFKKYENMKNIIINEFIDWYIKNKENNGSNYLKNNFKNDKELFKDKLLEINEEFYKSYQIKPFEIDIKNFSEIQIEEIHSKLILKDDTFNIYNKKTSNGIPKAILGKRNFLLFLNEILIDNDGKSNLDSTFFLRKEFISYLINEEDYSIGSANSYASYVSSAHKHIIRLYLKKDFFGSIDIFYKDNFRDELEDLFDISINLTLKFSDITIKNKYCAGLREYKYFLLDIFDNPYDNEVYIPEYLKKQIAIEDVILAKEDKDIIQFRREIEEEYKTKFEIDKESLISNFRFRMITQDRLYGDVYFPIRLIKKIFYKNDAKQIFDKFISDQIENIKIYNSSNNSFYLLKNIESLLIDESNQVKCSISAKLDDFSLIGNVFTELGEEGKFDLFKANSLRDVAIDHIFPMKDILLLHKKELTGLSKLTSILKEKGLVKSGKEAVKQLAFIGNQIIDDQVLDYNDMQLLTNDLLFLGNKLHLQLMSSKENLQKKNR